MDSLANQKNAAGSLSGTNINFFGPAMHVNNADKTLSGLQNRQAMATSQQSRRLHELSSGSSGHDGHLNTSKHCFGVKILPAHQS
ncbi:MAG: hypothetical protein ABL902_02740 [Gallionella sp.]